MSHPQHASRPGLGQWLMESEAVARIYESRLWRRNPLFTLAFGISFDRELASILDAAAPPPHARVLDLACGSGIYTRPIARRVPGGRVVGLDLSEPMLRTGLGLARREGLPRVAFVRASALELPFAAGTFDVVNCCGALHLFADVPRALAEIARVLDVGGCVTLAVIRAPADGAPRAVVEAVARMLGVEAFQRDALEAALTASGLGDVRGLHEGPVWLLLVARRRPR